MKKTEDKQLRSQEGSTSEKCKMESGKFLSEAKQLGSQEALIEDQKTRGQEGSTSGKCKMESRKLNKNFQFSTFNFTLQRVAFTLAEVLITIAVIGVVAAMTLPTLIQKQQKMTWVSQLKSSYSILNNGFKTMMAEEGVERIDDTSIWQSMSGAGCYYYHNPKTSNQCKNFLPNLKKYFKITSIEPLTGHTYKNLNDSTAQTDYTGSSSYAIHLSNGAMIWVYYFYKSPYMRTTAQCQAIKDAGGHMCGEAGNFWIDINGKKGPNIMGRDIFVFRITERGVVVLNYGIEFLTYYEKGNKSQIEAKKMQADGSSSDYYYACKTGNSSILGHACSTRIIEIDNWQMKY